ncbi:MAG TPA: biotin transporter BioY [Clostridiaceae bacterium]|nr:biotin transporter BioY [Clostridiaceae bacterium]
MKIKTKDMVITGLFSALMVVGAYIKIFLPVVPFSLQPFFCTLAGILLGSRLGALSQIIYAVLGLAGLPVFTQGGGLMYIFKPSFGYILGFIAGAYIIGKISELLNTHNFRNTLISIMSGLVAIYAIGIPYVYFISKFYLKNTDITFMYAITTGLMPFIIKDAILCTVAAIIATKVIPSIRR